MVLQMLVFQHSLQHEYDKPGRAVVSSCVCIPPSGPSYVRTLTPRGTMVDSLYPTRLSPPSEPYSEAHNPVSHKNGRGWMVGYRPRICASFPPISLPKSFFPNHTDVPGCLYSRIALIAVNTGIGASRSMNPSMDIISSIPSAYAPDALSIDTSDMP